MLKQRATVVKTVKEAWHSYHATLKICFFFSLINATIAEYFKLNISNFNLDEVIKNYIQTGELSISSMTHIQLLVVMGLVSMLLTIFIYGMLISIGNIYIQKGELQSPKDVIIQAFIAFKKRFLIFFIVCIINGCLWFFSSFLNILGLWLSISFTLVLLPVALLENEGIGIIFQKSLYLISKNLIYVLQSGLAVMVVLLLKYYICILILTPNFIESIPLVGIQHVILIFLDALILPLIAMLMIAVFYGVRNNI